MSHRAEDRHERDRESLGVSASSNRNSSQEKEKIEKAKVVGVPTGAQVPEAQSYPGRPVADLTSHKAGKPFQSRPIAPAAGGQGPMALHSGIPSGIMPGFSSNQHLFSQLLRPPVSHQFASHVPAGIAAAAAAMAAPRSGVASPMMRTSGLPQIVKPVSVPSQHSQSQGTPNASHTSSSSGATTTTTCASSSASTPSVPTTSTHSMQSQHSDHRASDNRESRPEVRPVLPDMSLRTASPHLIAQPHSSSTANQQSANPGAKIGLAISAAPSQSSGMHKAGPPVLPTTHQPVVHPAVAVTNNATSSIPVSAISSTMSSGHPQPKMLSTAAVAGTTALLSNMTKMYPQHAPIAAFQTTRPSLPSTDPNLCVDHSRLIKPGGTASPVAVSLNHTPSSSVSHQAISTPSSVIGTDSARLERPRQSMAIPGHIPYSMQMPAYFFQPDAIPAGYPYYPQAGFGANPSLVRPPTAAATAAAQAAQAAAAASGMGQIHMMDPRIISQIAAHAGAMGIGAPNVTSHSSDSSGVTTMTDGMTGNASGIYGFPSAMLSMASSANLQSQMSAANPNATSPRPSILRKRTSEGVRKIPTQLPFSESVTTSQNEPGASPRSDTTVSAPHSGQNSPKPPSDTGSQGGEQPTASVAPTAQPTDQPPAKQSRPSSPAKVKKDPPEVPVTTVASSTAMINGVTPSVTTTSQISASPAMAAADVAASPRKKPRKQNVIPTEDKYGSTVPVEANQPDEEGDRKPKPEDVSDEDLKFILLKRPKISIFGGYRVNTKAAHNHFVRYSDVRVKEERKPTIQDFAGQKGILQRANGWRVQHSAAQLDELNTVEQDVLKKMGDLRERLPKPKPGQKAKYQDELVMLHELVQGNIQRSQLVVEQLTDTRKSMVKILDHRRRAVEMLQKQMNKRNPKKKS